MFQLVRFTLYVELKGKSNTRISVPMMAKVKDEDFSKTSNRKSFMIQHLAKGENAVDKISPFSDSIEFDDRSVYVNFPRYTKEADFEAFERVFPEHVKDFTI